MCEEMAHKGKETGQRQAEKESGRTKGICKEDRTRNVHAHIGMDERTDFTSGRRGETKTGATTSAVTEQK